MVKGVRSKRHPHARILFIAVAVVLAFGCDSTELDPFSNDGRYFTVYGFLHELEDNHTIRVIPVTRRAERIQSPDDPQADIDAFVTTTDSRTGNTVVWNHSLQRLEDGSFAHIYTAGFRVIQNTTYRLEITRNDGKKTTAETRVPSLSSKRVVQGAPVVTADSSVFQDLFFPGVSSPWEIEVAYHFPGSPAIRIPYGRVGSATEDGGWTMRIDFRRDVDTLATIASSLPEDLVWAAMGVRLFVLDANWDPPLDVFDPEAIAVPGTLSNVENGYGFFGSVALMQDDWPNSAELNEALGF